MRRVAALPLLIALVLPANAQAAFPGQNGRIVVQAACNIYTMDPDGTDPVQVTFKSPCAGGSPSDPTWSPDGTKIAYEWASEVSVMNADGSGNTGITGPLPGSAGHPEWSPDGTRLAFFRSNPSETMQHNHVYTANVDGTDLQQLSTALCSSFRPTWHPDGKRIAVSGTTTPQGSGCEQTYDWFLVNVDGTGMTPMPAESIHDWSPDGSKVVFPGIGGIRIQAADGSSPSTLIANGGNNPHFSPDGQKVIFQRPDVINGPPYLHVVNADGTGETRITNYGVHESSWQPIPVNGYPRPKAGTPVELSLVPAYEACVSPNRTHSPPLAFGSCAPPQRVPGQLTVGTPDANGQPAKSVSRVNMRVLTGTPSTPADEADLRLDGTINDVRLASDLSDYTGSLDARVSVRITDKDNTPHPGGPGAATTRDITYSFPIPCQATADMTVGAVCAFNTTAEAFVPGIVKELRRSIWELGQLEVLDGAGNVFLRQGIFVP